MPIFKAGDSKSVKNYRHISLLSVVSKVLERLIFNIIISHIKSNLLLVILILVSLFYQKLFYTTTDANFH